MYVHTCVLLTQLALVVGLVRRSDLGLPFFLVLHINVVVLKFLEELLGEKAFNWKICNGYKGYTEIYTRQFAFSNFSLKRNHYTYLHQNFSALAK